MLSLRQFSKKAGVSAMTVSRVFSNPEKVAPETRRRIFALAEKLDFHPSAVRPSARSGMTKSVGVIYPKNSNSYFQDIAWSIQETLIAKGFLPIMLCSTGVDFEIYLTRLLKHRIDGLISSGYSASLVAKVNAQLERLGIPGVFIDTELADAKNDSVFSDNAAGGTLAAEHLLAMGHRRLGLVMQHKKNTLRESAFLDRLSKDGARIHPRHVVNFFETDDMTHPDEDKFQKRLEKLLLSPDCPTAIFASSDPLALSLYSVAGRLGIEIPKRVSVLGYADLDFCEMLWPPLSSVRQDGQQEGAIAARLLLDRISGDDSSPKTVTVPVTLIKRSSVKKLKS